MLSFLALWTHWKILIQNKPRVITPVSVSSHYNRLIELVSAMKRIEKQNYYPSSPCRFHEA